MITWTLRKSKGEDAKMASVRANRRTDVTVAIDFFKTTREVDDEENGFIRVNQKMFVSYLGFVDKEEYLTVLENGFYLND